MKRKNVLVTENLNEKKKTENLNDKNTKKKRFKNVSGLKWDIYDLVLDYLNETENTWFFRHYFIRAWHSSFLTLTSRNRQETQNEINEETQNETCELKQNEIYELKQNVTRQEKQNEICKEQQIENENEQQNEIHKEKQIEKQIENERENEKKENEEIKKLDLNNDWLAIEKFKEKCWEKFLIKEENWSKLKKLDVKVVISGSLFWSILKQNDFYKGADMDLFVQFDDSQKMPEVKNELKYSNNYYYYTEREKENLGFYPIYKKIENCLEIKVSGMGWVIMSHEGRNYQHLGESALEIVGGHNDSRSSVHDKFNICLIKTNDIFQWTKTHFDTIVTAVCFDGEQFHLPENSVSLKNSLNSLISKKIENPFEMAKYYSFDKFLKSECNYRFQMKFEHFELENQKIPENENDKPENKNRVSQYRVQSVRLVKLNKYISDDKNFEKICDKILKTISRITKYKLRGVKFTNIGPNSDFYNYLQKVIQKRLEIETVIFKTNFKFETFDLQNMKIALSFT